MGPLGSSQPFAARTLLRLAGRQRLIYATGATRLPEAVGAERGDAVSAQRRIFDRPALFSHAVSTKAGIGAEKMVVLPALLYVLCRCFVPFALRVRLIRDRCCLRRRGGQSCKSDQRCSKDVHFSILLGGEPSRNLLRLTSKRRPSRFVASNGSSRYLRGCSTGCWRGAQWDWTVGATRDCSAARDHGRYSGESRRLRAGRRRRRTAPARDAALYSQALRERRAHLLRFLFRGFQDRCLQRLTADKLRYSCDQIGGVQPRRLAGKETTIVPAVIFASVPARVKTMSEPKVRRLAAGGRWIRTSSSARDWPRFSTLSFSCLLGSLFDLRRD